jgi:hypothetical protein
MTFPAVMTAFEVRSQGDGAYEVVIRRGRRKPLRISGFRTAEEAQEWIDIRSGRHPAG